jgi:hypothetical protein
VREIFPLQLQQPLGKPLVHMIIPVGFKLNEAGANEIMRRTYSPHFRFGSVILPDPSK